MSNLTQPTPSKNVLIWKVGTFLYGLVILLNENVDSLSDAGVPAEIESKIKIIGIVIYFMFTYFHFNKTDEPT